MKIKICFFLCFLLFLSHLNLVLAQDNSQGGAGNSSEAIKNQAQGYGISEGELNRMIEGSSEGYNPQNSINDQGSSNVNSEIQKQFQEELGTDESQTDDDDEYYVRGSRELESLPYGYSIFNYRARTFEPNDYGPVDPSYPIGPGDEIIITSWGDVQLHHKLIVSRDGKLFIPNVGMVFVNSLSLEEAKRTILNRMSKVHSSIRYNRSKVDIALGSTKRIRVFVIGEVVKPGGYNLSSLSTSFNALYYCGGPKVNGSLRNIKIIRNEKEIGRLDVYDYLQQGKRTGDIRLSNNDLIMVPPVGNRVVLNGAVQNPSSFEMLEDEGLKKLIEFAGGLKPNAYSSKVHIERIKPNFGSEMIDVNLEELFGKEEDFILKDGDIITVNELNSLPANTVSILGEVLIPGDYQWKSGIDVNDLIDAAGGLLKTSYVFKVEVSRQLLETYGDSNVIFTVNKQGNKFESFKLRPMDRVFVRPHPDYVPQAKVKLLGEIPFPGDYAIQTDGETLSDLIQRAGGLKPTAFLRGVQFYREGQGRIDVDMESSNKNNNLKFDKDDIILRNNDLIFVPKEPATVQVKGAVLFPSNLLFNKGDNLDDYIARAGGFAENADKGKVAVTLANGRVVRSKGFLFIRSSIKIEPGSMIYIPKKSPDAGIDWLEIVRTITSTVTSVAMAILIVQRIDSK